MFKTPLSLFCILCYTLTSLAQLANPSLDYYLPQDVTYNEDIPKPQDILGWVPGTWHVSHDKLVDYMKTLAESSPRIQIENRGATFEGRPILLLTISSPENLKNLDEIHKNHFALTEKGSQSLNTDEMPIVTYQGMSVHGNEPSGANAGLLAAYYLAAAEGPAIDDLLQHVVILFDPSFNPDGLQRFAHWANSNKSQNVNPDPQDREYRETWPGGRTNHYWFDVNRDWLPVQLPESQARLKTFHNWYPNILTDHHEMGTNSSFFFQPGIPSRTHPLTPKLNQELTQEIGKFHAKAFDKIGSLYYTEEDYDDFYYGKGSTFPDINGAIGILFEQASSRGHAQETDNGIMDFPFTIRNQFTAFLSTLEAAKNMRVNLLNYQRTFFTDDRNAAEKGAYLFGSQSDPQRAFYLAEMLERHKIKIYKTNKDYNSEGKSFAQSSSYIVPKDQKHSRILKAMFETRTTFQDSLFYDISAWNFAMSFNVDFSENAPTSLLGEQITKLSFPTAPTVNKGNYGYLMPWAPYNTPKALATILDAGIRAKVSLGTFTLENKFYDYGTIFIPAQNQSLAQNELYKLIQKAAANSGVEIVGVQSGLTAGIDLGSKKFRPLEAASIALIVGNGITPYDAGEIWHLLDTRYNIKVTKLDVSALNYANLGRYTDIILSNSWGSGLDEQAANKLKDWVRDGGTLIGYRNAARWLDKNKFMSLNFKITENPAKDISFEQKSDFNGAQVIGGAIFKAKTDRSHPINFGYDKDEIYLFRNTSLFIEADAESYNNPIQYTHNPLASGYISKINLEAIADTRPFVHSNLGRGNVILFTDNTNFRAFWYGTNKLLMNAIFFGNEM